MQNSRFLGICLLVSSVILAAAIVYHANAVPPYGRYQAHQAIVEGQLWIVDTTTGQIRERSTKTVLH